MHLKLTQKAHKIIVANGGHATVSLNKQICYS